MQSAPRIIHKGTVFVKSKYEKYAQAANLLAGNSSGHIGDEETIIISSKNLYGIVYKITNLVNGKIYIGLTRGDLGVRIRAHFSKNVDTPLANAVRKFGKINFIVEVLCFSFSKKALIEAESSLIKTYESCYREVGYNRTRGGEGCRDSKNKMVFRDLSQKEDATFKKKFHFLPIEMIYNLRNTAKRHHRTLKMQIEYMLETHPEYYSL